MIVLSIKLLFPITTFNHKSVHTYELTSVITIFLGFFNAISFHTKEMQSNMVVISLAFKGKVLLETFTVALGSHNS